MPSTDLEKSRGEPLTEPPAMTGESIEKTSGAGTIEPTGGTDTTQTNGGRRQVAKWRRMIVRAKRAVARTVHVRMVAWETIEVGLLGGLKARRYCLTDPAAERVVHCEVLVVHVPDAACLERLAGSCLLHGRVREVRLQVATMPTWLRGGLRPVRVPATSRCSRGGRSGTVSPSGSVGRSAAASARLWPSSAGRFSGPDAWNRPVETCPPSTARHGSPATRRGSGFPSSRRLPTRTPGG